MSSNLSEEQMSNDEKAMQLATAMAVPMAMKVAMELGLLEIISKAGPGTRLSASDIANRVVSGDSDPKHASQMIDRVLCLLSTYSVVTCSAADHGEGIEVRDDGGLVERVYGLGSLASYFSTTREDDDSASFAPLFHMIHDNVITQLWYHSKEAILEGKVPFNKTHGKSFGDYIGNDERFAPLFYQSVKEYNIKFVDKILEVYKGFEGLQSIVDVGGGNAYLLKAIISKYPKIKGVNFDLPHVIEKLETSPGIHNVAGDMFTSPIPRGDAIFMKWVLRNIDDEKCLKVLKKCYEALPDGGKLIVTEMVIPDVPDLNNDRKSVFQFDIFLSSTNDGGRERRFGEFEALAKSAGFSPVQTAVQAYTLTLLEFHKIPTH